MEKQIIKWLNSFNKNFIIGVSGGIDSAVTSSLCAMTGRNIICLNMPINQEKAQVLRAEKHIKWLKTKYNNISSYLIDLSTSFKAFQNSIPEYNELAMINSRSRLRMMTLYSFANSFDSLVVGTGNKVEDFGIGFFTKYGDGGVDISPIGDLTKTEVYEIAKRLDITKEIRTAKPTDGLWEDSRTDEEQIGATYPELEEAMAFCLKEGIETVKDYNDLEKKIDDVTEEIIYKYLYRHQNNKHKMETPPICQIERH